MASIYFVAGWQICSGWVHASKGLSAVPYGVRVRHQLHRVHLPAASGLRLCPPAKRVWLSSAGQLLKPLLMCLPDCCLPIHDSWRSNCECLCICMCCYVTLRSYDLQKKRKVDAFQQSQWAHPKAPAWTCMTLRSCAPGYFKLLPQVLT